MPSERAGCARGHVKPPIPQHDAWGMKPTAKHQERGGKDHLAHVDDFSIQANSLALSYNAAIALGIPRHEIHACVLRDDLLPPRFDPSQRHLATVAGLRRLVSGLVPHATPGDALLFIAANHCGTDALATAAPVDELAEDGVVEQLTPDRLNACLSALPGAPVLVVATCHAGIFLPLADDRRTVLAACAADDVYLVPRRDCKWPAFLDEIFGAWCSCALSDAVPRARLPLDEAFARTAERLAGGQVPLRAGTATWP